MEIGTSDYKQCIHHARCLARRGQHDEAARVACEWIPDPGRSDSDIVRPQSIVLGGMTRVGKTRIAREMEARSTFVHIELDRLRRYFHRVEGVNSTECRDALYHHLAIAYPRGFVFEGSDAWHFLSERRPQPDVLDNLKIRFVLLGIKDDCVDLKAEQIHQASRSGRDRYKRSMRNARALAESIRRASRKMERMAQRFRAIDYLNVRLKSQRILIGDATTRVLRKVDAVWRQA